jgi:hypothetical protein
LQFIFLLDYKEVSEGQSSQCVSRRLIKTIVISTDKKKAEPNFVKVDGISYIATD